MEYPKPVRTSSGSRVGFHVFATEEEARQAAAYWAQPEYAHSVAAANIGLAQVGYQGRTSDGLHCVVVP